MRNHKLIAVLALALAACSTPAPQNTTTPMPVVTDTPIPATSTATATETSVVLSDEPALVTLTASPASTAIPTPTPTEIPVIELLFTGQIVPGRCVQAAVESRGGADYIYDALRPILSGADLTISAVNGSISDHSPKTGCVKTFVLTGGSVHAGAMAEAGIDIVSVATNHIKNCGPSNCGDQAFLDTLANLRAAGVVPVGGGLNHAEALAPVVMDIQGIRFVFVSLGQIEPRAFAGEDSPGIAILNEENLSQAVQEAGDLGDVVIALPHWGPEYVAAPNYLQLGLAKTAVAAGADLVIGNHTHVIQAHEEIEGVPVFYGLGNFVFDQTWSEETTWSIIVRVQFLGSILEKYEIIPVISTKDGTLRLAEGEEAAQILAWIEAANDRLR
jgi:poly-gamma-glutamate synthesis protein (capsule biosynthesis protein)